ncbi:hypothetical protein DTW94_02820 [Streptomyces cavourensis]|uniref:Uncharacterized protein n=1 Tax=Streptomyces cavourensis TaxID=67258 RepID=A0AAD0Q194_9ACTN|nr:hypothetical protein DTW94_02820 [Streptomyces cavourensis]
MRSHAPDTAAPALRADDATFDTRPSFPGREFWYVNCLSCLQVAGADGPSVVPRCHPVGWGRFFSVSVCRRVIR